MTAVIIAPEMNRVIIQRSGVFSLPCEDSSLRCNCVLEQPRPCGGIAIRDIPLKYRKFELLCTQMGKRFIERQAARGFEYLDSGNLLLHGPWPSKLQNLSDASSPTWRDAMRRDKDDNLEHSERSLIFVAEPSLDWYDYVLVGDFAFKDHMTDLELP